MRRIKKTASAADSGSTAPSPAPFRPTVDYPREGERLGEGYYTVRISAPANAEAEIRIDNGDWQKCRESSGYWWFDWVPLTSHRCKIEARARVGKGRWIDSDPRVCRVGNLEMPLHAGMTFD